MIAEQFLHDVNPHITPGDILKEACARQGLCPCCRGLLDWTTAIALEFRRQGPQPYPSFLVLCERCYAPRQFRLAAAAQEACLQVRLFQKPIESLENL